jgi:hypothetical protein
MSHRAFAFASVIRGSRLLAAAAVVAVAAGATALSTPAQAAVVAPTIMLPNMTVAEGDSGTMAFTVNVGLTAPNPFDHAVKLEVVDYTSVPLPGGGTYGNATPGTDTSPSVRSTGRSSRASRSRGRSMTTSSPGAACRSYTLMREV